MPSDVDICNLALSHIGDVADVQSIYPPDGSTQAGFCSRFYPIAISSLLEMHTWDFATSRVGLAPLQTNPAPRSWRHAYAVPAGMLSAISVLSPHARNDYSQHGGRHDDLWNEQWFHPMPDYPNPADIHYTPQPFTIEIDSNGNKIILTDVRDAVLRYTVSVDSPNQFSSLFALALSYQLASMLAGPIIKGDTGMSVSTSMLEKAAAIVSQAKTSDANQRWLEVKQSVPWMARR